MRGCSVRLRLSSRRSRKDLAVGFVGDVVEVVRGGQ